MECFSALGLPIGASEENVKEAYRRLAKTHHPDLGGSTEKFVRIQRAYESIMGEHLKDLGDESSPNRKASYGGSGSGSYWTSWDTGGAWWRGGKTSERDFDAEFEDQWRSFTNRNRKATKCKFRTKRSGNEDSFEDFDASDGTHSKEDSYRREKEESAFRGGEDRKKRKRGAANKDAVPMKVALACEKDFGRSVTGEYLQVAKFNGRVCFSSSDSNLFLFWSNKNKDWKISDSLKDDGNCLAFNDSIHPSKASPFCPGGVLRWMIWNQRARRYLPVKLEWSEPVEDYSSWTVDQLREALERRDLRDRAAKCVEKDELVELMKLFGHLKPRNESYSASSDDPIPEGQYRLCSRQRHDGVVQSPPVLSDKCKVGNNRVENYCGSLNDVEAWLQKHGDRRRYYGVFDSDKNFCFGLIWKNNKVWGRAGVHDW